MSSLFLATLVLSLPAAEPERDWTVMIYGAVANSAEETFLPDIEDLRHALPIEGFDVVALVDRSAHFTNTPEGFGEDFADTRLYGFDGQDPVRLAGGEHLPTLTEDSDADLNMGDAHTLRAYIRWAKEMWPAKRYALLFYSHGGGWSWCPDEESGGDDLHPGELTDVLTEAESVDLMIFDVCSMAGLENAYQWRPGNGSFSADYAVATPNAGYPFPWNSILHRVREHGADGTPATPVEFGRSVLENTRRDRLALIEEHPEHADELNGEAQALLDLSKAAAAKEAFDALAVAIASAEPHVRETIERERGRADDRPTLDYFVPGEPCWLTMPYFDAFDFCRRVAASKALPETVRLAARNAMEAVDAVVVDSFGLARYPDFEPGKNGAYVIFPDGSSRFEGTSTWRQFSWLHPDRTGYGHGRYAWCRDGATRDNGRVENWFELLDLWCDEDDVSGGSNGYRP